MTTLPSQAPTALDPFDLWRIILAVSAGHNEAPLALSTEKTMGSGCSRSCNCSSVSRREFLKAGAAATALATGKPLRAKEGDFPPEAKVPPPKGWWDQLLQRGKPITYVGPSLQKVAFPLGGIGTGSVALHGTGRLVEWQIFNQINKASFVDDSFFAIRVQTNEGRVTLRILQEGDLGDLPGCESVEFRGEYPIATVRYIDPELPVEATLEALNPMIPLNEKDSALPCAIFLYHLRNPAQQPVRVQLLATLQNAVGHTGHHASKGVRLDSYGHNINEKFQDDRMTAIRMGVIGADPPKADPPLAIVRDHELAWADRRWPLEGVSLPSVQRACQDVAKNPSVGSERRCWWLNGQDPASQMFEHQKVIAADARAGATLILSGAVHPWLRSIAESRQVGQEGRIEKTFADFEGDDYGPWVAEGKAVGSGPAKGKINWQQPVSGFLGKGLVNTFLPDDETKGTLVSPEFTIELRYINFLIGGGNKPGKCCLNLLVKDQVVLSETGHDTEQLARKSWDVERWLGKNAKLQIVDDQTGGWGHILVDDIRFSNLPPDAWPKEQAEMIASLLPFEFHTAPSAKGAASVTLPGTSAPVSMVATGRMADLVLRPGAEVLVKGAGGEPLVIAGRVDKGRVIVVLGDFARGRERTSPQDRNRLLMFVANQMGIKMTVPDGLSKTNDAYGTMCLATPHREVGHRVAWTRRSRFWTDFSSRGGFSDDDRPVRPSPVGSTYNGALSANVTLAAGQSVTIPFVIAWNFPNHYWGEANVGNRYTTWFADAPEVAKYVAENLDRLVAETRLYRDTLYAGTLPHYLIDAFGSQASIIRSQTCFWCVDGTFAAFEGCGGNSGCCPMNCNHVWNYEQALAKLWPGIERNMRVTELDYSQFETGGCAHRVRIPRPKTPEGDMPVADGQCGAVLKAYREYLQSPDEAFTKERWTRIKKAMEFAITTWDKDQDGVMEQPQFNTYDRDIYGHNTFVTSLYLGALRAAEELAKVFGDADAAKRFRSVFERGRAKCAAELFNGEYYIQKADTINLGYGTGVWADQVVGQWWARILNLGDILPLDQVRSSLKAIFKYNWLWTQVGFQGTQRYLQFADGDDKALLCGSWPKGGRPADPILYRDEAWTGVEYQVAAHKIWEGQLDEGLAIVKGARERYNGIKRNPWNEIECGDHYARAMSSWSLLLAAQGYTYCGPTQSLGFDPRIQPENHQSFFTTAEGWGSFSQKREGHTQRNELTVAYGRLPLRQLSLGLPEAVTSAKASVSIDGKAVACSSQCIDGKMLLTPPSVTLERGQKLAVEVTW